jgi:hypothetical protein
MLACFHLARAKPVYADEVAAAPPAGAAEDDRVRARRMGDLLSITASSARDARVTSIATGLASGVALMPTGIVLTTHRDEVGQSIGVGMTATGSAALLFALLSLRSSKMEQLSTAFEARRASGMSDEELVRATETEWSTAAEKSHDRRRTFGVVSLALGIAASGAGAFMLLADAGVFGQSRNTQYTVGSILVGSAVPIAGLGLRALLQESPEETAWRSYRALVAERVVRASLSF